MIKLYAAIALGFALGSIVYAHPATTAAATTSAPIVFFDVAGPDAAALKTFYAKNFGWTINGANGITTANLPGTLRQDPPETLIYLGVSDIDASLKAIVASGGSVVVPRTVGIFRMRGGVEGIHLATMRNFASGGYQLRP